MTNCCYYVGGSILSRAEIQKYAITATADVIVMCHQKQLYLHIIYISHQWISKPNLIPIIVPALSGISMISIIRDLRQHMWGSTRALQSDCFYSSDWSIVTHPALSLVNFETQIPLSSALLWGHYHKYLNWTHLFYSQYLKIK